MHKTTESTSANKAQILVDTNDLMTLTHAGKITAIKIGDAAHARVKVGKRVLWNVSKVNRYINEISE